MAWDIPGSTGNVGSLLFWCGIFTFGWTRMKEHASELISDEKFSSRHEKYPLDTPDTKEAYYIRELFEGILFQDFSGIPYKSFILRRLVPLKSSC